MTITPFQTFLAVLGLTGAFGYRHGWGRSAITSAFILGSLLFLLNGGSDFLASILANGLGGGSGSATGATQPTLAACTQSFSHNLAGIIFGVMTWLGYSVGYKYGPEPQTANHRVAGLIPGGINGATIAYYVSNQLLPGRQFSITTPGSFETSSYLPLVFGIGFVALLVVLFVAGQTSKSK